MYRMTNGKCVSSETVDLALQEHFKAHPEPKPKFEPISIHHGCFEVSASTCDNVIVKTGPCYNNQCYQCISTVDEFIAALQSAKAFIE